MSVDKTPFDLHVMEEPESGERFAVIGRKGTEVFVEAAFVDTLATIRETDVDAYLTLWQMAELLAERGAPLEAIVS